MKKPRKTKPQVIEDIRFAVTRKWEMHADEGWLGATATPQLVSSEELQVKVDGKWRAVRTEIVSEDKRTYNEFLISTLPETSPTKRLLKKFIDD